MLAKNDNDIGTSSNEVICCNVVLVCTHTCSVTIVCIVTNPCLAINSLCLVINPCHLSNFLIRFSFNFIFIRSKRFHAPYSFFYILASQSRHGIFIATYVAMSASVFVIFSPPFSAPLRPFPPFSSPFLPFHPRVSLLSYPPPPLLVFICFRQFPPIKGMMNEKRDRVDGKLRFKLLATAVH